MTGQERAQAAKAMARAKVGDTIPANASVNDVLGFIMRQFKKNQAKAYGRV